MNIRRLILGILLMAAALGGFAAILHGQPLYVGPGHVGRMAVWEVASLSWKPWTMLGYGAVANLYVGPGDVARLAYWDVGTGAWREWDGTIPIGWIVGTAWKVWYTDATGHIVEVPLGPAGTFLTSTGPAAAPAFSSNADTLGHRLFYDATDSSLQTKNGNARGIAAVDLQLTHNAVTQVATGDYSVIAGGARNTAERVGGFLGGGYSNILSGPAGAGEGVYSVIVGGYSNVDSNKYDFLGGGLNNVVFASQTGFISSGANVLVGGINNVLGYPQYVATSPEMISNNFMGGGSVNRIAGRNAGILIGTRVLGNVLVGGEENFVSSQVGAYQYNRYNALLGGLEDSIWGTHNVLGGGLVNKVYGDYNALLGGRSNVDSATYSFIGAGQTNQLLNGSHSAIVAGRNNVVDCAGDGWNFVGAPDGVDLYGGGNVVCGGYGPHVIGDRANTGAGWGHFIGGGQGHFIKYFDGFGSVIVGGMTHVDSTALYGFIGSGTLNETRGAGYATVVNGNTNVDSAEYGFIGNGQANFITTTAPYSFIGNGNGNLVEDLNLGAGYNTLGGGDHNLMHGAYGFIGGGRINEDSAAYSVIAGGQGNLIQLASGTSNTIGGGYYNTIHHVDGYNTIGGGVYNHIRDATGVNHSNTISGGMQNEIQEGPRSANIAGGELNWIGMNGSYSALGGGYANCDSAAYAVVAGGESDSAFGTYSVIAGGQLNYVSVNGTWGSVGGGYFNKVNAPYGVIPGGDSNAVAVGCTASVAMGKNATAAHTRSIIYNGTGAAFSTTAAGQAMFAMPNGLSCMDSSRLNPLGGTDVKMYNGSQDDLYRGHIVKAMANAGNGYKWIEKVAVDDIHPLGTVQETRISSGAWGWITVSGAGYVAVIDGRTQTVINGDRLLAVCAAADVGAAAGLANCYTTAGVPTHDREVGHPISDKNIGVNTSAATDSICVAIIHFR